MDNSTDIVSAPIQLTMELIAKFYSALQSPFQSVVPPTLATVFRESEFAWLKRLGVNFDQMLHTEQEYQYLKPLQVGDRAVAVTPSPQVRARSGMRMIHLKTTVSVKDEPRVVCHTTILERGVSKGIK